MTVTCCTIADSGYLPRTLAMARSLATLTPDVRIYVCCTDDAAYEALSVLQEATILPLRLGEIEESFPTLSSARTDRSPYEFLMTVKPFLIQYVLKKTAEGAVCFYCDGDLFFFHSLFSIMEELGTDSVLLTPHNEPDTAKKKGAHGLYNAGFVAVRRTAEGEKAVEWWCDRVHEWCRDYVEGDKFIDQKYLDRFPELFRGIRVSQNPGLNVAPWNVDRYTLEMKTDLTVDGSPLVFYHFHALKKLGAFLYSTGLSEYRARGSATLRRRIYGPYLSALDACAKVLGRASAIATIRKEKAGNGGTGLAVSRIRQGQWLIRVAGQVL